MNALHCVCKQSYKEGEIMIECENIRCPIGWFHPRCVGIKDEELVNINNWFCSDKC